MSTNTPQVDNPDEIVQHYNTTPHDNNNSKINISANQSVAYLLNDEEGDDDGDNKEEALDFVGKLEANKSEKKIIDSKTSMTSMTKDKNVFESSASFNHYQ